LQLGELVDGILTYRAPTKFIAEWVENNFRLKLETAWQTMGQPVTSVRIETKSRKLAA
jgi:chromosomal replication initiation ATPase DnaA